MYLSYLIAAAIAALLIFIFLITYKVVDPNEAHVVVFMGRGRKVYAPIADEGSGGKTAYFYIPFLMKRFVLPLTNMKMDISDIHLNDKEVAPFICDVICWLHINNPIQSAERLDLSNPFGSLKEDLINIVQAIARTVAMKQEVLDIMRDRQTFAESVGKEVGDVLDKWGIELINLEVNDIRDDQDKDSQVIYDYENMRKIQVSAQSRKEIAKQNREAIEVEKENEKMAEIARIQSEEAYQQREIQKNRLVEVEEEEKLKAVGVAAQKKQEDIQIAEQLRAERVALQEEKANLQKVAAYRKDVVGRAEAEKDAQIEVATGKGEAIRIDGAKKAEVVRLTGEAEGKAIEAKGTAEAMAKDKMAEAMAKFNDSATGIEKIRAWIEVEKAKYEALGMALSEADLKLVQSGKGGNIFGFPLNAETGADIGQMIEAFGFDKETILSKLNGRDQSKSKNTAEPQTPSH